MVSSALTRRALIAGGAALAFGHKAAIGNLSRPSGGGAIDIHHHLLPPFYKPVVEPWLKRFATNVDETLTWTPARSLTAMNNAGVERSVLSISAPGVDFGRGQPDIALARECNDYAANLVRSHPDRFSFFAVLPMPDVEASIAEATRALDKLRASGVVLLTNYNGRYLGDDALSPLWEMLHSRKSNVYVHPTMAACCAGLVPNVADPLIELPVDTGRTIGSLLWSGTLSRNNQIRFIFSHGAGILPMVAERLAAMRFIRPALASKVPEGPTAALSRIHVDLASVTNPAAVAAVRAFLADSQILYGTDFPWGMPDRILSQLRELGLSATALEAIRRGNALRLLSETIPGEA
jgi:predicted TIM-barrel fold metal-dependent hydrolase